MDAEGNDIGYKRSMDKAMKALKDRRHIKGRKSGQVKREEKEKRAEAVDSGAVASPPPKRSSLKLPKKVRDPLTTDDAGHALLLLRNASEEVSLEDEDTPEAKPRLPLNKRKAPKEVGLRFPFPAGLAKPRDCRFPEATRNDFEEPRRRFSERSQSSYSEDGTRSSTRSASPRTAEQQRLSSLAQGAGMASAAPVSAAEREAASLMEQLKGKQEGMPVLWQSVIVSREKPQASLAEMLVNAKQRLDALSSIQQAVSAPICLIYPPSHGLALRPAAQQVLNYPGQVSLGQIPLGSQVQLAQFPMRQVQGAAHPGLR